jgi:hypothetical protein
LNGGKQIAAIKEGSSVPAGAGERDHPGIRSGYGLVVGEIYQPVLVEPWMQHDIHQSGEALRTHFRDPRHRSRIEDAVPHDAQPSLTLGYQNAAIGKKGHTPRLAETFDHRQTDLMLNRRIEHDWAVRKRGSRPDNWRRSIAAATTSSLTLTRRWRSLSDSNAGNRKQKDRDETVQTNLSWNSHAPDYQAAIAGTSSCREKLMAPSRPIGITFSQLGISGGDLCPNPPTKRKRSLWAAADS